MNREEADTTWVWGYGSGRDAHRNITAGAKGEDRSNGATEAEQKTRKEKVPPQVRFESAQVEKIDAWGYQLNAPVRITGRASFLSDKHAAKIEIEEYVTFKNANKNVKEECQRVAPKYRTVELNDDGTFVFDEVPLYWPNGYTGNPDKSFKDPMRYTFVISHPHHEKPLSISFDAPTGEGCNAPILKKGMYDDNAVAADPGKYVQGGDGYIAGAPICDMQKVLRDLVYAIHRDSPGVFGEEMHEMVVAFQRDSLKKNRVASGTRTMTEAESITSTSDVDGIIGSKTREEIRRWQSENFLRPIVDLFEGDFDKQAVTLRVKSSEDEKYVAFGTPVYDVQADLQKIGGYTGCELDGWFGPELKTWIFYAQDSFEKGEVVVNGAKTILTEKLSGFRRGAFDIPTQKYVLHLKNKGWTLPARPNYYGGFELRKDDKDGEKKWGGSEHKGQEGAFVGDLQKDLMELQFLNIDKPTGSYGPKTEAAVKNFQDIARKKKRKKGDKEVEAGEVFQGTVSGICDQSTAAEIAKWKGEGWKCPKSGDVITFPDTSFKIKKTTKPVEDCIKTLQKELRPEFRKSIETIIREMHTLGIAFGVKESAKAGYRTFQQQTEIDRSKTKADAGESFHNYGLAVDLGVLEWVDEEGKKYNDFWLGQMDAIQKYKGFSGKIWAKRNSFANGTAYSLSWEVIHLQGVPADSGGRAALIKALNKAAEECADAKWKYKTGADKKYQCTLGSDATWTTIGTSRQMLNKAALNCTDEQKKTIKKHMDKAESLALTIEL